MAVYSEQEDKSYHSPKQSEPQAEHLAAEKAMDAPAAMKQTIKSRRQAKHFKKKQPAAKFTSVGSPSSASAVVSGLQMIQQQSAYFERSESAEVSVIEARCSDAVHVGESTTAATSTPENQRMPESD